MRWLEKAYNPLGVYGVFCLGIGAGVLISEWIREEVVEDVVRPVPLVEDDPQLELPFDAVEDFDISWTEPEHPVNVIVMDDFDPAEYEASKAAAQAEPEEPARFHLLQNLYETWDYEREKLNRHSGNPYFIHQEEFEADEEDLEQLSLTYYEGDDTMCDPLDVPIYNYRDILGELRFGYGTDDEAFCYKRAPGMGAEYSIEKDPRSYAEAVHGILQE
jgi:hypothetical protein